MSHTDQDHDAAGTAWHYNKSSRGANIIPGSHTTDRSETMIGLILATALGQSAATHTITLDVPAVASPSVVWVETQPNCWRSVTMCEGMYSTSATASGRTVVTVHLSGAAWFAIQKQNGGHWFPILKNPPIPHLPGPPARIRISVGPPATGYVTPPATIGDSYSF